MTGLFRPFALVSLLAVGASASMPMEASFMSKMNQIIDTSSEIRANSDVGAALLKHARRLDNNNEEEGDDDSMASFDASYLMDYSLKFQGCHHIPEWNKYADGSDDLRISTHRLVRFRLCPAASCQNSKSAGCSSKYGDYIVDLNTFVYSFLYAQSEARQAACNQHQATCEAMCDGGDDESSCQYQCFAGYGLSYCMQDENASAEELFDPLNFAQCTQFDLANNGGYYNNANRDLQDYYGYYYLGPYCADQGGSVHLGLFADNTCTTFQQNGEELFYSTMGFELPYSSESLITYDCVSCTETVSVKGQANGNEGENDYYNNNEEAEEAAAGDYYYSDVDQVKYFCEAIYATSGKCESKMTIDSMNEAACNYIEGIKIVRESGVIRTHSVRSSKTAAVTIGLFTTLAVLLGAYVFYLRNKLGRAKISLSSQG
jgi:hypothetical protein